MEALPVNLLDNSKVLFELFDSFVRDKNPAIATFANVGYRLVFGIESCDRKVLLMRLVGFVCERSAHTMALADSGLSSSKLPSNDITTSALMILSELNQKHPKEMKHNGLQILVANDTILETVDLNNLFLQFFHLNSEFFFFSPLHLDSVAFDRLLG